MKRLLLPLFSMVTICIQAQWVNIPDSNFGKWLSDYYPGCMQGNTQTGFMMDTTCASIANESNTSCQNQNISSLEGLQYFKLLQIFVCTSNNLTNLPQLPSGLQYLICDSNRLTSLPNLPNSLSYLDCHYNQITSFPALPNSLITLFCYHNRLVSLPTLPNSLENLQCYQNLLSSLPLLPNSLIALMCYENQITSLPTLPTSLKYLDCNFNLLSSLPALPDSLSDLNCGDNQISELPSLPSSMTSLVCGGNQIDSLPLLPSKLNTLACDGNQITSLPLLPSSLAFLNCGANQISSLPALPPPLLNLYCHANQLTYLPLLPNSLLSLVCHNNQLTNLPLLPTSLSSLNCSNNIGIVCIPSKLGPLSELKISGTGITCMPNRFNCQNFDINPNTLPLCDPQSGCAFYYNITGNVHQKTTSNCIQDSLTPGAGLSNIKMMLAQNGQPIQQTYAYSIGEYSFDTDSNTNYTLSIDTTSLPLNVACPTSFTRNLVLTNVDSIKQNQNFGLECKGVDVGVLSIQGRFRAGRASNVNIVAGDIIKQYYNANCASNVAGTVVISFTGSVTYVSPAAGALTPTSVSGNSLSYAVSDFSAIPFNAFNIVLATDTHAVIGTLVCITVTVSTATDINLANNTLSQCFQVVNSYDPNAKEVFPKYISRNGDWLTYTVHFQNTGNDTAYDVIVRDTLSSFVDANSFQFLASSHEKKIIQINGNALAFTFPNINLVDSATNPAGSQGWFQFKVKTKPTLPLLTNINNIAFIYFDFNPAIKTNTATTVVEPLGINETETSSVLQLYPNPNKGSFTLHTPNPIGQTWQLTDVLGRPIAKGVIEKEYELIQFKDSNAGVYIFTCAGQQIRLIVE